MGTTHITRIEHGSILSLDFWEHVALVAQQSVHVPDEPKILLVLGSLTDGRAPFFNQFQYPVLHSSRPDWWPLGESPYKLIQELLCANLEVERVAAVFDADI